MASAASGRLFRPLLKWAGGKRQLLPVLRRYYPSDFNRYIEPFVGSGAVFFDLCSEGLLDGRPARLTDMNPDLIGCYRAVRENAEAWRMRNSDGCLTLRLSRLQTRWRRQRGQEQATLEFRRSVGSKLCRRCLPFGHVDD